MQRVDASLSNLRHQRINWRNSLRSRCLIEAQQIWPNSPARRGNETSPGKPLVLKRSDQRCYKIGNSQQVPRPVGETLEDKGAVGGLGLAAPRKSKARISMQKAYGFLVWTRVQSPPSPLRFNGRVLNLTIFHFFCPSISTTFQWSGLEPGHFSFLWPLHLHYVSMVGS